MSENRTMSVRELRMDCTFPLGEDVEVETTIPCGKTSESAVILPEGGLKYRCPIHKGLIDGTRTGAIRFDIPIPRF